MAGLESDPGSLAPEPIFSPVVIPPPQYREHNAEWRGDQEILPRVVRNERVHFHEDGGEGHSRQREQHGHESAQAIWGR